MKLGTCGENFCYFRYNVVGGEGCKDVRGIHVFEKHPGGTQCCLRTGLLSTYWRRRSW
jgi:hypothetical protein